jgi:ribosome biogenesis GTPase
MKISELGFDPWFERHIPEFRQDDCHFARIAAVDRSSYRVIGELGEALAELSGKLLFQTDETADLPCVGDWVTAQYYNDNSEAIIHRVLPRRTFLRRKSAGHNIDIQMIGANIDTAFLVQSCHFDFNPRRLERYLVMTADGHVKPIIVLTKTDLIQEEELRKELATIKSITNAQVIALSNITGAGLEDFSETLESGRTYCLLGSSGVGKTTLLNRLLGKETFATKAVSSTGEGTHTTTRRQLILLGQGAMLIDTPGMRELGMVGSANGVNTGFDALAELAGKCRYADCTHQHEPGCAVRVAIEQGALAEERYDSYIKLKKESAHYEMSSFEKRKKDKAFGKFVKAAKKGHEKG